MATQPALAVKELVSFPLAPLDRWGLPPIPLNTGRDLPSIRPSTGGGAHCYRCVRCLRVLFGVGGGKTDETSTLSTGTGGGAVCCRGGWFQRCPLESSMCRESKRSGSRGSNPRTGRLKTTGLTIRPSISLTQNDASFTCGASRGGVGGVKRIMVCQTKGGWGPASNTVSPACCT